MDTAAPGTADVPLDRPRLINDPVDEVELVVFVFVFVSEPEDEGPVVVVAPLLDRVVDDEGEAVDLDWSATGLILRMKYIPGGCNPSSAAAVVIFKVADVDESFDRVGKCINVINDTDRMRLRRVETSPGKLWIRIVGHR